ncbi:hypothetical protein [Virgibacillus sp. CBA3643]|uniref:hypothetical protein n=1 Tax=Virgibacillus sp. CBA3643 TaxID=2942278 RepID=UPI0035A36186
MSEKLEVIKDILNSPGHVFFGSISDEGEVSQDVADAEPYFKWLVSRVEELENEIENLKSDYKNANHFQNLFEQQNKRYKQALEEIENDINGNAEGLDAESYLKEAKEIAHEALEGSE